MKKQKLLEIVKRELIDTIKIDKANLEHIAKTGEINGTLLIEIERVMTEFAAMQANGAEKSDSNCNIPLITASILKDKNSFENDMAAATLNVMLKHKVITGYKGDFGRWIDCETKFKYLHNAGGIYVENLDFTATESDYRR